MRSNLRHPLTPAGACTSPLSTDPPLRELGLRPRLHRRRPRPLRRRGSKGLGNSGPRSAVPRGLARRLLPSTPRPVPRPLRSNGQKRRPGRWLRLVNHLTRPARKAAATAWARSRAPSLRNSRAWSDGVLGHEQLPADLRVALAVRHPPQHLQLALGERQLPYPVHGRGARAAERRPTTSMPAGLVCPAFGRLPGVLRLGRCNGSGTA
jgi:hypothetical protein